MACGRTNIGGQSFKINNAVLGSYNVMSGETITAGDLIYFNGGQLANLPKLPYKFTADISVSTIDTDRVYVELGPNKLLLIYTEESPYHIKAKTLTINSDGSYSFGAVYTVSTLTAGNLSACLVDEGKVILYFTNTAVSWEYNVVAMSIVGDVITVGSVLVLETTRRSNFNIFKCALNKAVVTAHDVFDPSYQIGYVVTASGLTLTKSSAQTISTQYSSPMYGTMLSEGRCLVVGQNYISTVWYDIVAIMTVSGNTITLGASLSYPRITSKINYPIRLNSTTGLVLFSGRILWIVDVSGVATLDRNYTSLTFGTGKVSAFADSIVYIYYTGSSPNYGTLVAIGLSKTNLSPLYTTVPLALTTTATSGFQANALKLQDDFIACADWAAGNTSIRKVKIKPDLSYVKGLALESGTAGQSKKAYDWR